MKPGWKNVVVPILVTTTVTSASVAIAVPLVIKKIAEKKTKSILEQMIPLGGPTNSLANKDKINFVALGDSVTAGYDGYLATDSSLHPGGVNMEKENYDYLSYTDFIANSLAKTNRLGDYRNFAKSGDKIPDDRLRIFRNPVALKAIKKADLIALSLGANDLLSAVEFLKISFGTLMSLLIGEPLNNMQAIVQINNAREHLNNILDINDNQKPDGGSRDASPSNYASRGDIKRLINESFDKLTSMLKTGGLGGLVDIEQELLDKIFKIIELDLGTFLAEIHQASPNAKIIVLGYAFPFHLFPETMQNDIIPDRQINNKPVNMMGVYSEFIDTLKRMTERANYIKFFDANKWKEFSKDADAVTWNLQEEDPTTKAITNVSKTASEWTRAMPNPLDIHPSTYGHQVIGGHLFEWIASDMGLQVPQYQSIQNIKDFDASTSKLDDIYTYAGVDKGFDILDEKTKYESTTSSVLQIFTLLNNREFLKFFGTLLENAVTGKELGDLYDYIMNNKVDASEVIQYVFKNMPHLGEALFAIIFYYGGKGTTPLPGHQDFKFMLAQLLKGVGGSLKDSPISALGMMFVDNASQDLFPYPKSDQLVDYLKQVVEMGKKMGLDITPGLPADWESDDGVAKVFIGGTESKLQAPSILHNSLAKIDWTYKYDMDARSIYLKTPKEAIANNPDYKKYYIYSWNANPNTDMDMYVTVVNQEDTKFSVLKDEIVKTIVSDIGNPTDFRRNINIHFQSSSGQEITSITLDVSGKNYVVNDPRIATDISAFMDTLPHTGEVVNWP